MRSAYLELALEHFDPKQQLFFVVLSLEDELDQVFVPIDVVEHLVELRTLVYGVDVEAVRLEGFLEQFVLVSELLQFTCQSLLLLLVCLFFLLAVLGLLDRGGELFEALLLEQERALDEQVSCG